MKGQKKREEPDPERIPGNSTLNGFLDGIDGGSAASRRDFLKLCGYSIAAAALSSCQSKVSKAVPYIIAPVEMTPGEALYYASTYINGSDYCSIIVKTRDGRPIKIEGNPGSSITLGGTNARVQASVLDLYDPDRFRGPAKDGLSVGWQQVDEEITSGLSGISDDGGSVVLLTPTVFSPSTEAAISLFIKKYPGSEWIRYDAVSYSAMAEANKISFGIQAVPDYRFDNADVIVSVGADFLGAWLSPIEHTRRFSSRRDPEKDMNYLVQIESGLSLTGCNADTRIQIKPSQEYGLLLNIYSEILRMTGKPGINAPPCPVDTGDILHRLVSAGERSLVISGSNTKSTQLLVNEINRQLGNLGTTILFDPYLRTHNAIDSDMEALVRRMNEGRVDSLVIWNVNPVYTWYNSDAFTEGLKKVRLKVSLSGSPDETNTLFQYICPDNHYLESWGDAEPKKDSFSLSQPVIAPLYNTRQMADSLLRWSGSTEGIYDLMQAWWTKNQFPRQKEFADPVRFFDNILQKGVFEPPDTAERKDKFTRTGSAFKIDQTGFETVTDSGTLDAEVVLYESVAIGEGRQANNPWLQELPDPVTRICWDNYASISIQQAAENNLLEGDLIQINGSEFPVHIQPGQTHGTVSISFGYGRRKCGFAGEGVGSRAWGLLRMKGGNIESTGQIRFNKVPGNHTFAQTQSHHTMEGRALIRVTDLSEFRINPASGNELHEYYAGEARNLYKERYYPHHHWGMVIDLSKCTGCGNCVIACQAENNIPVVGREEVSRVHEMHWLRIDRYFTGQSVSPDVVFQPVLCQHCQNAPCENVCPVAATNHSSEGLNQMIYNRCFGTRYCNNNCPYKVRRFNWFNYTEAGTLSGNLRDKTGMTGDLRRMVLNPDVTVRSQGVIEKCSFCIQRIQASKLKAKTENRSLRPGEISTACSQSCPAKAIIFGDMNEKESEIGRLIASGRRYNLLEELFTKPSVHYLTKVRNRKL